jgi:hypothetical protein
MVQKHGVGSQVEWNWGGGTGKAKVEEVFTSKVTRTIKGTEVTRDASEDEPAYMLRQDDGDRVLKSHSELRKAR